MRPEIEAVLTLLATCRSPPTCRSARAPRLWARGPPGAHDDLPLRGTAKRRHPPNRPYTPSRRPLTIPCGSAFNAPRSRVAQLTSLASAPAQGLDAKIEYQLD